MLRFISWSNALSYASLFAAFLAIHFSLQGYLNLSAALLAVSALLDNYDGAFAGLFKRDDLGKEFGKELDSLIDCIAFGIVPVICLRVLLYPQNGALKIAFAAGAFIFVVAAVTRLGYFNILERGGRIDFVGLPTTEAALILATVLLFPFPKDYLWTVLTGLAVCMLLPIKIRKPKGLFRVLLALWLLAVIAAHILLHVFGQRR